MVPRFGIPPDPQRRYRLRPGAYALLLRGDDVLLTARLSDGAELQLPGGGIDPGENQIAALHREVAEETGWTIGAARRIGAYRRFAWLPDYQFWAEKICHVWIARPVLRRGFATEPDHAAIWAPMQALPDLLDEPAARDFLRLMLGHGAGPGRRDLTQFAKDRPRNPV